MNDPDPHRDQPVLIVGGAVRTAPLALVLLHGRGATAESLLPLAAALAGAEAAVLAPQAAGNTWYPQRFIAPLAANEPWRSSALGVLDRLLDGLDAAGPGAAHTVLAGFSQGACLALDYAASRPRRYGAVLAFSGGLIGADDELDRYTGSLEGTPVFLGCSDDDPHIPLARLHASAERLRDLGAAVTLQIYPGMGHTILPDEVRRAQELVALARRAEASS